MQNQKRVTQYTKDELDTLETCVQFYKLLYPTPTPLQSQLITFMLYDLHGVANTRSTAIGILNIMVFLMAQCRKEPNIVQREKLMECCESLGTIAGFLVDLKELKLLP